jgi:hypothetical protein
MTEFPRTIGREVDELSARSISVVSTSDGLWVTGRVEEVELHRDYTYGEVLAHAQAFY